jgi:HNH endonuclease
MTAEVEVIGSDLPEAWATRVWAAQGGKCSSCGSDQQLKVHRVVPVAMGGSDDLVSNGVLLCRTCEIARDIHHRETRVSAEPTRPINFWVSQGLHAKMRDRLNTAYGFRSVSSLVRFLMTKYVEDPNRFEDDLVLYQDSGSDVKINVWVSREVYEAFQRQVQARNVTVTDALKSLIQMYENEHKKFVVERSAG